MIYVFLSIEDAGGGVMSDVFGSGLLCPRPARHLALVEGQIELSANFSCYNGVLSKRGS